MNRRNRNLLYFLLYSLAMVLVGWMIHWLLHECPEPLQVDFTEKDKRPVAIGGDFTRDTTGYTVDIPIPDDPEDDFLTIITDDDPIPFAVIGGPDPDYPVGEPTVRRARITQAQVDSILDAHKDQLGGKVYSSPFTIVGDTVMPNSDFYRLRVVASGYSPPISALLDDRFSHIDYFSYSNRHYFPKWQRQHLLILNEELHRQHLWDIASWAPTGYLIAREEYEAAAGIVLTRYFIIPAGQWLWNKVSFLPRMGRRSRTISNLNLKSSTQ